MEIAQIAPLVILSTLILMKLENVLFVMKIVKPAPAEEHAKVVLMDPSTTMIHKFVNHAHKIA